MRAAWRQLRRALAFRLRGLAHRLSTGLRLAA
jgi:hypothetical protein